MMSKAAQARPLIEEENWRVSDKIRILRRMLQTKSAFPLMEIFSTHQSRAEIIVLFLAVLELMKTGELNVGREQSSAIIQIYAKG
mgnify:FL=1